MALDLLALALLIVFAWRGARRGARQVRLVRLQPREARLAVRREAITDEVDGLVELIHGAGCHRIEPTLTD